MPRRRHARAQTGAGGGGSTSVRCGGCDGGEIYARYSPPALARGAIQLVDLPGFFARSRFLRSQVSMPASDPSAWVVHKFGGSSVADGDRFKRVANILESLSPGRLGVVLSACRGVTDALLGLVARAEAQDDAWRGDLDALRERHATMAQSLLTAEVAKLYMAGFDRDRHDIEGI